MKAIKYFFQFLIIFSTVLGYSQEEETLGDRLYGQQLIVPAQPTLSVVDPRFGQLNTKEFASVNPSVNIHIGFQELTVGRSIDFYSYDLIFKAKVKLLITRYNSDDSIKDDQIKEFEIDHNNALENFKVKDYIVYKLPGTHKATVKVLEVTYLDQNNQIIIKGDSPLYIELKFNVERYYNIKNTVLNPIAAVVTFNGQNPTMTPLSTATNGEDELKISWQKDAVAPAVEYELEWTWLDNYSDAQNVALGKEKIKLTEQDFRLNSTRIQTKGTSYNIPLIFSKGYLVYRVRPVGRFLGNISKNYYGAWSCGVTDSFATVNDWPKVVTIGKSHEGGGKNWQYQSSFAEDGKKKEVVSYFDGSLRNRQTVTKINSNNQTVVGEVIYDNQGRAAIEVLPVPVESAAIKYFGSLNQNLGNTTYSHLDFDWDDKDKIASCLPSLAAGMSTNSGSSKYYSEQSVLTGGVQDFVPHANKYPFSQIEYTPDNTGRIRSKGGVGNTHQIGIGHEMKYFYLQPEQEELNRLFGYKVGDFGRYKKNLVVDPNGQVSVSYLDPQGRTVATALAGNVAGSLDALEDEKNIDLHKETISNLLSSSNKKYATGRFGILEDGISLNSQVGVESDNTTMTLNYGLKYLKENTFGSNCISKKFPFVYDLSIGLKDDCAFDQIKYNQKIGTINISNTASQADPTTFNSEDLIASKLKIGSYTLGKDIIVNKEAVEAYADEFIKTIKDTTNVCYPDTTQYNVDIDIKDCSVTCNSCEQSLVKVHLNAAEYAEFLTLFPADITGSSLGSIEGRRADLLAIAKKEYVIKKLRETYPDTTFSYAANNDLVFDTSGLDVQLVLSSEEYYKKEFDLSLQTCRELCTKKISVCNVNEETLLADLSPEGQYGSIDGISYDTAEGDVVIDGNTGSEEVDPSLPEEEDPKPNAPIQVITDQLSVFNEYNQLLKGGANTVEVEVEPDPAGGTTTVTTVVKSQSKYSWKFPATPYLDEQGNPVEVTVTLVRGKGTSPLEADGDGSIQSSHRSRDYT
jgi:hypothetical protein